MVAQLDVTAPFDGAILGRVPLAGQEEVQAALQQVYSLYRERSGWLPAWKRAEIFRTAARLLGERAEDFALAAARETDRKFNRMRPSKYATEKQPQKTC